MVACPSEKIYQLIVSLIVSRRSDQAFCPPVEPSSLVCTLCLPQHYSSCTLVWLFLKSPLPFPSFITAGITPHGFELPKILLHTKKPKDCSAFATGLPLSCLSRQPIDDAVCEQLCTQQFVFSRIQ